MRGAGPARQANARQANGVRLTYRRPQWPSPMLGACFLRGAGPARQANGVRLTFPRPQWPSPMLGAYFLRGAGPARRANGVRLTFPRPQWPSPTSGVRMCRSGAMSFFTTACPQLRLAKAVFRRGRPVCSSPALRLRHLSQSCFSAVDKDQRNMGHIYRNGPPGATWFFQSSGPISVNLGRTDMTFFRSF